MDFDPPEEELDSFSLLFPLPYRIAILIVLGIWLWRFNVWYLNGVKIDAFHLIRHPSHHSHNLSTRPSTPNSSQPTARSIFAFAAILTAPLILSISLFWLFTHGDPTIRVPTHSWLPNTCLLYLILALTLPSRLIPKYGTALPRAGRQRLNSTIRRIALGGIARTAEAGKFGDVLLADALTSYAKPFSECAILLYTLLASSTTSFPPDRELNGYATWIVPLVMMIPFAIRLRQCLIDGQRANALKYATAFPAITLSALQQHPESLGEGGRDVLFNLWLLAVVVNTFYSFYWDVAQDWDLTLFSSQNQSSSHPYGLRRPLLLGNGMPELYYSIIGIDLLLRCTWSLKLSVHLEHVNDIEGGIFMLEVLEVGRRWMWAFVRMEAEHIRGNRDKYAVLNGMNGNGVIHGPGGGLRGGAHEANGMMVLDELGGIKEEDEDGYED